MKRKLEAWALVLKKDGAVLALSSDGPDFGEVVAYDERVVRLVEHNPDDARVLAEVARLFRVWNETMPAELTRLRAAVERREKRLKKGAKR